MRKLLLTCVLTLLDPTTPVPLTLAVLVSALAQVLHAAYKPFTERKYYFLQHGSLACTLLVFTIGLMFKVKQTGIGAIALTVLLVGMCTLTLLAIVGIAAGDVWSTIRQARRARLVARASTAKASVPKSLVGSPEMHSNPLHVMKGMNPLRKARVPAVRSRSFEPMGSDSS